jgi:hypothetical protein
MPIVLELGIVALVIYALVRWGAKLAAGTLGSRQGAYRKIAAKYRGRCEARGLVDPPTVSFTHQGAGVRVGLAPIVPGQPGPPRTRVVVRFARGIPLRLELLPRDRKAPAQQPRGTREVAVGPTDFDRTYLLQANDADIARAVFALEALRDSVEALRRLCPPAGVLLSINPERLLLQVDRNLGGSVPGLDLMVRTGLLVHDWVVSSVAGQIRQGVEVVEVGTADTLSAPPVCEVCGCPIVGEHVACSACGTPCHADCWAYVGRCSTFGCGGTGHVARPS